MAKKQPPKKAASPSKFSRAKAFAKRYASNAAAIVAISILLGGTVSVLFRYREYSRLDGCQIGVTRLVENLFGQAPADKVTTFCNELLNR